MRQEAELHKIKASAKYGARHLTSMILLKGEICLLTH